MKPRQLSEARTEKLRGLARQYQAQGYIVYFESLPEGAPDPIRGFRPDLIARRGDEVIVVEVKNSRDVEDARLDELAERISNIRNWRLELVWLGDTPAQPLSHEQLAALVREAHSVRDLGHLSSALLLGWAAAEAILDSMLTNASSESVGKSAKIKVSSAESLGLISKRQFDALMESVELRNRVAHGRSIDAPAEVVDLLLSTVQRLSQEGYASVDQMVDWFREHYENPAEHMPYDSAEGGYQYIAGGPYNASDVLEEEFPGADERDREEAVGIVESEGTEWVKKDEH